jgi:hypothetical protein
MPADIRASFEETTGKNLSWLFDDLINTDKYLDYKINGMIKPGDQTNNQYVVMVKNAGEIAGPVCLNAIKDGKVVKTIWYDGFVGTIGLTFPAGDYDEFMIDQPERMPEVDRKNNTENTSGVFKKMEPLKFQFVGSLDNPTRTQLFYTPTVGFNNYDKFMVGAAIYNHVIPGKTFEWCAMPMYSTKDKSVVGHADAFFTIRPNSVFQDVRIGANANQYHFYDFKQGNAADGIITDRRFGFTKVAPEIDFDFKKAFPRSPISQSIVLRAIWIKQDEIHYNVFVDSSGSSSTSVISPVERTFYEASYTLKNSRALNGYDFTFKLQSGDEMNKLQLTANYHLNYAAKKKIDFRLFAGTFLSNAENGDYRFRMSGWGPLGIGNQDYLFDNIFLGRSEKTGLMAQQMAVEDGGFKVYTQAGQSTKWLTSLDVTIPLPMKNKYLSLIKIFADAGVYDTKNLGGPRFEYEAGLQVGLIGNDVCTVYFPLLVSQDIKDNYSVNGWTYRNMIRFTFNLNKLNPFKLVNNIQI